MSGADTVSVVDGVSTGGSRDAVEILQGPSAGDEKAVRADGAHGGEDEAGETGEWTARR